jgi:iron(III) transport system ATP-binding protein
MGGLVEEIDEPTSAGRRMQGARMQTGAGSIAVRLENVSRSFGATAAVRDISLQIPRGDVLSLVGHSGCGKSTLLRIISGVETIDSGQVFLDGREVDGRSFVEPEARGVGFVFQDYALFPHLNVRDNILFGLKGMTRAEATAGAENVVTLAGIGHLVDRFPHTLSGGEQQRVALARALAPRPGIILMDEPFSNLDQGLRGKVRTETLSLLKSLGTTVIMVTHDPQEALSTGDHVVLMRSGDIVQAGSAYDLHDRPIDAYAAEFFCPSNQVPGVRRGDQIETAIGNFPRPADGKPEGVATLHIRPQAIAVSLDRGDIAGRIEQRIFHGEMEQVLLTVAGLDAPLKAVTSQRLPEGTRYVKITISRERVLVF